MRKEYEYYYEEGEAEDVLAADRTRHGGGQLTTTHYKPLVDKEETVVELRDPATETFEDIRGILHKDSENYPDCPLIWVVRVRPGGKTREEKPWAIEVLEEMVDEEVIDFEVKPKAKVPYGGRRGRMLADMLKERDEKSKG